VDVNSVTLGQQTPKPKVEPNLNGLRLDSFSLTKDCTLRSGRKTRTLLASEETRVQHIGTLNKWSAVVWR